MILVYPGSFDPITNGHLDIITRAVCICDKLIVAVGNNENKKPAFTVDERIDLIRTALKDRKDIEVTGFGGLLADFVKKVGAQAVIKGLRAMSDFEYEFQMALTNRKLNPNAETVFLTTSAQYMYLSSSLVKQIAQLGGDIRDLVPSCIVDDILRKARQIKS